MGCFPLCPGLEEGVFRHHAATRRLTVLEDLPPNFTGSMIYPSTRVGVGRVDSALEERILINQLSMARVKDATMRLAGALPLVPTASAAFVGSGKALPPVPEMAFPAGVGGCPSTTDTCTCPSYPGGGCPSTTDTCNCPDIYGASYPEAEPTAGENRAMSSSKSSSKSSHPGIGMQHHEPTINNFLQPSTHRSHIASTSTAAMAPPHPAKYTIPHSMSNNDISTPLPAPPRAKVRHMGLTPSYSSPSMNTEVIYTIDGPVQIPRATLRTFSIGRPLTIEERVERLAKMRAEALATVEAREREAMGLGGIEEEDDDRDRAIAEATVWI